MNLKVEYDNEVILLPASGERSKYTPGLSAKKDRWRLWHYHADVKCGNRDIGECLPTYLRTMSIRTRLHVCILQNRGSMPFTRRFASLGILPDHSNALWTG